MTYVNDIATSRPPDDETLIVALRTSVTRLSRRLREDFSGSSLTPSQLSTLGTLLRHGEITIGELARIEIVKPPSMTRIVNHLEGLNLVRRIANQSDGRHIVIAIAPLGEALLTRDQLRCNASLQARIIHLTDSDRDLLRRVAPLLQALAQK